MKIVLEECRKKMMHYCASQNIFFLRISHFQETTISLSLPRTLIILGAICFSASKMLAYARHLALFLVLVTLAESKKGQDPCQGYEHSDFRYKLTDPYDCRKFWMCSGGPKGNHFTCPPGRSFNPDSKFGSCTGPPPSEVKACFKNEGF